MGELTLTLFNGQNLMEDYTISATVGGLPFPTPVSLPANTNPSSAVTFTVTSLIGPITEVDVTTPNAGTNGWDFFVDDIHLTVTPTGVVPEPGSLTLFGLGLVGLLSHGWRSRKATRTKGG